MTATDVVVTGLGATTPLGGDVASTWDGLLNGRSGVRRLEVDWVERYDLPAKIGAPLVQDPSEVLPRVQLRRLDRCEAIARAIDDGAGLGPKVLTTAIVPLR